MLQQLSQHLCDLGRAQAQHSQVVKKTPCSTIPLTRVVAKGLICGWRQSANVAHGEAPPGEPDSGRFSSPIFSGESDRRTVATRPRPHAFCLSTNSDLSQGAQHKGCFFPENLAALQLAPRLGE